MKRVNKSFIRHENNSLHIMHGEYDSDLFYIHFLEVRNRFNLMNKYYDDIIDFDYNTDFIIQCDIDNNPDDLKRFITLANKQITIYDLHYNEYNNSLWDYKRIDCFNIDYYNDLSECYINNNTFSFMIDGVKTIISCSDYEYSKEENKSYIKKI